jgi:uncharacterized protein (DUF983 family)
MAYLQTTAQVEVHLSKQNDIATHPLTASIIIALPLILLVTITGYRKYKALILRQQIANLERMWRLKAQKETY